MNRLSEQSLSSGFADPADYRKIWLAYVDFLRRGMTTKEEGNEQFEKGLNIKSFLFLKFAKIIT